MSEERIQKILAHAGVASRRASEDLIEQGRVTVDGRVATLGDKADPQTADIRVDGARVATDPGHSYVMLNKPQGVITTLDDPEGRPTVVDLINVEHRVVPVGRLDMDTEGLLLLTNDGELVNGLLHPSSEVERTYVALVPGSVRRDQMSQLRDGVTLEDGRATPRRARILEDDRQRALVEVVMTEGRKREVRRMLEEVGLPVRRLARVAFGGVELGELRQGKWRFLTNREVSSLYAAAGLGAPPQTERSDRDERDARRRAGEGS